MRGMIKLNHMFVRLTSLVLALVIVSICLVLVLNYLSHPNCGRFTRSEGDSELGTDGHVGQQWSSHRSFSKSRAPERVKWQKFHEQFVPVYVLEEHHEAARYWLWAAQAGVLPRRSHNTLIHFDAHTDMAPPIIEPGFPLLRWPKLEDVSRLVNENDKFIQAVVLTGLFSRVVWVWPTWGREGIPEDIYSDATIWNITLGSWQRPVPATKIANNQMHKSRDLNSPINDQKKLDDLCICVKSLNPPKHWNETMRGKHCLRVNSSEPDELPHLFPEGCRERLNLTLETYSETDILRQMEEGLFQQLSAQDFVLDIDEDFFGCEPVAQSLYDVGLKERHLEVLSFLIEKLFCGDTAEHELLSDFIFQKIIRFLMDNRSLCGKIRVNMSPAEVLKNSCILKAYRNITTSFHKKLASLNTTFVDSVFCKFRNDKFHKSILYHLLGILAPFKDIQLRALEEVGVCFQTSLHTFESDEVGLFRLCDGYNRPNDTIVTFYAPKVENIKERGKRLQKILGQLRATPDLVTVCRSVRDGYTPRHRFRLIEKTILRSIKRSGGDNVQIMYDRDLLGGKNGWWHRHKMESG